MKISYLWLQDYFEKLLPTPEKIAELLTEHAFEVESIDKVVGDIVLDVKVLPDRSHDCLCHIGMAREVSVLTGLKLKQEISNPDSLAVPESNVLRIEVEDEKLCKRFSALMIENVEVKESPAWLKERLIAIGQRSINNIVDATNYVMFAIGQPLHAYDRELLKEKDGGWKIVARKAVEGESLLALDNKQYRLNDGQLAIVDGNTNGILGIAGIKGGKASEISKHTKNIIIESANFESVNIRKTAKAIGLRTDASVRFENEITPYLTVSALKMVSELILNIAGTNETQIEGMADVYSNKSEWKYSIGVSAKEVNEILGTSLNENDLETIINRLGFPHRLVSPEDVIKGVIPSVLGKKYKSPSSMRDDAPEFFSCSSLISYLYNFAGIWMPSISIDKFVYGVPVEKSDIRFGDLIFALTPGGNMYVESKEWMKGTKVPNGIDHVGMMISPTEVLHSSRHNPEGTRIETLDNFLKIHEFRGYKRIPALGEGKRLVVTIPPERLDLRLKEDLIEEIGRINGYENLESKPIKPFEKDFEINKKEYWMNEFKKLFVDNGFSEVITYIFRNGGEVELANPIAKDKPYLRANLLDGLSEAVEQNSHNLELLGLTEVEIFEIGNVFTKKGEHTALALSSVNPEEIKKKIFETTGFEVDFKTTGNIHETNFDEILGKLSEPKNSFQYSGDDNVHFKSFSPYPFVLRDIAVFVPEGDAQSEIIKVIEKEASGLLANYKLFDTFTKQFPEGKKTSYAYRLVFQSMEKTLTDDEVNQSMIKSTEILNSKTGWQVR